MGWTAFALLAAATYEVEGRITPAVPASVVLHGAVSPFTASTLADASGRFRFRKVDAATYTLSVFAPSQGEVRRTIVVGPSTADKNGRVSVSVTLDDALLVRDSVHRVSAKQLAVPEKARREYERAQQKLSRRDIAGATEHLLRAIEITPQFTAARNNLGTIAYQTQDYPRAEKYFREALVHDPEAYEPLVNLGGVLVTLGKTEEAIRFNGDAVLKRPTDALANSQLGMAHHQAGNLDLATKYLGEARKLDPAHFSHPQLSLAHILVKQGRPAEAAEMLQEFLRYHPDNPHATAIRGQAEALRKAGLSSAR